MAAHAQGTRRCTQTQPRTEITLYRANGEAMTLGELLVTYGPHNMRKLDASITDVHWLAAGMSEPTIAYCPSCGAAEGDQHKATCLLLWRSYGNMPMPNPYARIDTKPALTPAQRAVQRAVRIMNG